MTETFEQKLESKMKEAKYLSLSDLGDTIKATILGEPQFKTDKRGNEALYIQLKTATGTVVQKFGKSIYETLGTKMKACGGLAVLQTQEHVWKQEKAGRATFNRYYPVPNKKEK
jgi:hypothetical protein